MKITFNGKQLWDKVKIAKNPFTRFKGLMWKKQLDNSEGLIISHCNQVHCFNMRFPIDVIYLSDKMEVLNIATLFPGKVGPKIKNAKSVLEVSAGTTNDFGIVTGDILKIDI